MTENMKSLNIVGIDGKKLAEYIKLTAPFDSSLQLYFTETSIRCYKQHQSETCSKYWDLPYVDFIDNADEVSKQVQESGSDVKLAITDLGKFIKHGLYIFKEKLDLTFNYNDDLYAIGRMTMSNASKLKIRHSIADGYTAFFADLTWDAVATIFSTDTSDVSFSVSKEQLKRIKQLARMDTIAGKLIEYVEFETVDNMIVASTLATEWAFKPSEITLAPKKIQSVFLSTLRDAAYNVYIKQFAKQELMVFVDVEDNQKQSVVILTEFNTNIELKDIEDQIGSVTFEDFAAANELF